MSYQRMDTKAAADYLGYSVSTLERWRGGCKNWFDTDQRGPRYASVRGRIWYRRDWLDDWLDSVWSPSRPSTCDTPPA